MTTAKQILELIEKSDLSMGDLNAIDVCVEKYLRKNDDLEVRVLLHSMFSSDCVWIDTDEDGNKFQILIPQYTRSRDALKGIRPKGWTWVASTQDEGCHFNFYSPNPNHMRILSRVMQSDFLPTEELAELHAIIKAIEYERSCPESQTTVM